MKESEVNDAIAKLNEIEKFEISGSKILFNNVELDINIEQLHNFINQSINDIHLVHYFNGIIDSYEKLKMSTPVVTSKKSFKQKKILFTMFGWNESGGGTMFPRETAIELAGRGYGVTVFFAGLRHPKIDSPYYIERSHDRGVDLIGVYNRKFDFIVPNEPELEIRDEKVIRAFEQVLESVYPDIIHFQNFLGLSFGIAEIASSYNCKKFFTPHNYHVLDPQLYMFKQNGKKWEGIDFAANSDFARNFPYLLDKYTERNKKAVEIVTNSIDRVLAISSRVKELFIKGGIPERKISVVHQIPLMHNGKYKLNEKTTSLPLKIGYFGSLIPHKGVHILVEAVQFLNSAKINVKLYGKGPLDYVAWLKSLDKHKVCEFKGEYLRENLGAIASGLDLVVVPSIWEEGAGLVILEAHYYGLPVICSKIGGMPEFIKNYENGLLFESGNIVELSNILNDLIKFPNKIDFMKNQTRLEKSFFDFVDYLEKIYFSYDNNVEDFMI